MPLISADQELELILAVLGAACVPTTEARVQGELLLEADLRGYSSHGLQRLPVIVGRIRNKLAIPQSTVKLTWSTPSAGVADGRHGLGPVVAGKAVEALAQQAPRAGIAAIAIRNANHIGILAPYVERLAAEGLIGLASTTSEALVHPWGGNAAMLGTNPIAIAIPAQPQPFVLDMATGVVSMGEILAYRAAGRSLPKGWALDSEGRSTTDPVRAARGAIAPFGGAKGYALGLALELLVAGLSSTEMGPRVTGTLDSDMPATKGDLFMAIDPPAFGAHELATRISPFLAMLRQTPTVAGATPVRIPGDRAQQERRRRIVEGIEHSDATLTTVQALRDELLSR